jgi:hypothetical protein
MSQGPFFIPQGAPPGSPLLMEEERPPEAVYYFRIYIIVMLLSLLGFFGFGLWLALEKMVSATITTSHSGQVVVGMFIAIVSLVFIIPHAIALFGGRAKWVYTLSVVLIGLSMLWNSCCLPVTIPLLIVWLKPETKKWFGVS